MDKDKVLALKKELDELNKDKDEANTAKIAELEAKIEKLENVPVDKAVATFEVGPPSEYKGFKFHKQGTDQPEMMPSDPKRKERVIKEVLDMIAMYKEKGVFKVMNEGTGSSGGDWVPEEWVMNVEEKARLISVALQDCRRYPMAHNILHIPKQGTSVTVTWANESAASSQSEPGAADLSLTAKRVGLWGKFTQELFDDAVNDIVSYITRDVVEALGQEIDDQVFNGSQFTGVLGAATNTVTFGAANAATSYTDMVARNFYDAIYSMASVRRRGAKFYLPKELLPYIQSLTTGAGGTPLMSVLGGAQAANIGGYSFSEVEAIDGTDSTGTDFITFGSLQNYALGVRLLPNSIELNPYAGTEFKQFEVLFRMYARLAGAPVFNDVFVTMNTV